MSSTSARPGRVASIAALATLAIFGALLATITLRLRVRLRDEVLHREAEAIHSVALMQIETAEPGLAELGIGSAMQDLFDAVLVSSKLRGVYAVQLFDATGVLREALPRGGQPPTDHWWPHTLAQPEARFLAAGSLDDALGFPPESGAEPTRVPLLDVVVPLQTALNPSQPIGVARYWIKGDTVAEELSRLDHALASQAGIAFGGGGLLIALVLAWAFSSLTRANRRLLEQSADLARANEELDFAAKTGALGAISAHLIHGLKNPLAGIEGFVAESGKTNGDPSHGFAWTSAMETTRRLRGLVNEVVAVLRDESVGDADYRVPLIEITDAAKARVASMAAEAGVALHVEGELGTAVAGRTANLAGLVLANLLTNAIEATPRNGRVSLEARANGAVVEFRIADTGGGLPPGVRGALFRPVQSGKPGGGGVGLAISHRLAKHTGGDLELVRTGAGGTVFRLSVPALTSVSAERG